MNLLALAPVAAPLAVERRVRGDRARRRRASRAVRASGGRGATGRSCASSGSSACSKLSGLRQIVEQTLQKRLPAVGERSMIYLQF
jgi:hypothetical protein